MQKYITIQFCRPLCTTKEPQTRNLESVSRLRKNAKTTVKFFRGRTWFRLSALLQCFNNMYKKNLNRIFDKI